MRHSLSTLQQRSNPTRKPKTFNVCGKLVIDIWGSSWISPGKKTKGKRKFSPVFKSQIQKRMAESKEIPSQYDLDAKWDAYLDLGVRRFVYSSATGVLAGLLLFRSPVTRWASVAFGAGIGIGSAYSECSHKFNEA
ncbi:hypothetical protein L2E82_46912 [Cichorium intybus]|uniref:Uncharacterized protein n=1 Tax=Cichorium intybus TaxID=13427 RepID=A0ACB8YUP2_CICIN|nr:hypothetical protein L2E82_46912 [Cichorium intybus]